MADAGVRDEPFGRIAVFEDLYGSKWDLIERQRQGKDGRSSGKLAFLAIGNLL
jgi:hypothetical protein